MMACTLYNKSRFGLMTSNVLLGKILHLTHHFGKTEPEMVNGYIVVMFVTVAQLVTYRASQQKPIIFFPSW